MTVRELIKDLKQNKNDLDRQIYIAIDPEHNAIYPIMEVGICVMSDKEDILVLVPDQKEDLMKDFMDTIEAEIASAPLLDGVLP